MGKIISNGIEYTGGLIRDDIADNLNTYDATKVLSARQGAHLNYIMERIVGTDIAEYSEDATYAVGDYCIYADILYKCITPINIPIAFDSSRWEATTLSDEIKTTNNKLTNLSIETLFGGDNMIQASGDVVEAAKTAPHLINLITTGSTTTNLPSSSTVDSTAFNYSIGLVLRRTSEQIFIILFSYRTAYIAYGAWNNGGWSGWSIK